MRVVGPSVSLIPFSVLVLVLGAWLAGCAFNGADSESAGARDYDSGGSDGTSDHNQGGDGDADGDTDVDVDADADADGSASMDEEIVPPSEEVPPEEQPEEPVCNIEDEVELYLSADDSNSMAGPVVARHALRSGSLPWGSVRIYEYLNYYDFDYEAAAPGEVRLSAHMRPVEGSEGLYALQIGVRAPDLAEEERRPLNITMSLDTSGSMSGHPIEMVRESCLAIASSLREGDLISMVTWDTIQTAMLVAHEVTGPDDPTLTAECRALDANGGTDLARGLDSAYELASANFSEDRINRVVLMSDGGANVGVTSADLIAGYAEDAEGEAIYLMGVGMGHSGSGYDDSLMDAITDKGKGAYVYIDSADEAWAMLGGRFLSTVEIAVRDVQVRLTLPPTFSMEEFHGEEVSEIAEEVEPQHLAPNDAMIYHQTVESCAPELLDGSELIRVAAITHDPFTREATTWAIESTIDELIAADNALLLKGDAIVAYAQALDEARNVSGDERQALVDGALDAVEAALAVNEGDRGLLEIQELLELVPTR